MECIAAYKYWQKLWFFLVIILANLARVAKASNCRSGLTEDFCEGWINFLHYVGQSQFELNSCCKVLDFSQLLRLLICFWSDKHFFFLIKDKEDWFWHFLGCVRWHFWNNSSLLPTMDVDSGMRFSKGVLTLETTLSCFHLLDKYFFD